MKNILLMRTDRMGDVVLTTPSIELVKNKFPKARISFMASPGTAELVSHNPYIDEVILYDKQKAHKSWYHTLGFALGLRCKKFDAAIIFNPTNRNHWVSYLANIPIRIGYTRKAARLLTHTISDRKGEGKKSEAFYNEDLLSFLDIPTAQSRNLKVSVPEQAKKHIAQLIEKNIKDHDFIVMNISASCPSKVWPLKNYARLCDLIFQKLNIYPVIIGKPEDCANLKKQVSSPLWILKEDLSLTQLAALFEKSKLHISGDTGPLHIASAVGTPVMTIFGRTLPGLSPTRWGALKGNNKIFHKDIGCNPCLAHLCKLDFDCQRATKVEEVFYAVKAYT